MIELYQMVLESLPDPIWIESTMHEILFVNKAYENTYHMKLEEIRGKTNQEVFSKDIAKLYDKQIQTCLLKNEVYRVEGIVENQQVECTIFPIKDTMGVSCAVAGIIRNIEDRKKREVELEKQKNILRTIIDAVPEAIFYKDRQSKFIGYNKNFEEFYKARNVYEILGKTDLEIYEDQKTAEYFMKQDQEIMATQETKYFEYNLMVNDEVVTEENVKIPIINEQGESWGIVGLSRNITERKRLEERLRYLSEIDILTGLYNRYSFEEKLKKINQPEYLPLGIIMGDINGLKLVNDTLGHLEGDRLIQAIAKVLKEACGTAGDIFRWGGDEFIMLLPHTDELQCEQMIEKIITRCKGQTYQFVQLNIALGGMIKKNPQEDIYECINQAEEKVYRQKLLEKKSIKSSILESLLQSLQEKNMETKAHTERVVAAALAIGMELQFKRSELDELALAAKLHDIGKIGIHEEILLKPTALTPEEFEIMKGHTEKGYRIIQASSELVNVAKVVLTHHERWDGKGYPLGLKGEEIPLLARIISVVDAYDVMTHDRIYQQAITQKQAIREIKACAGNQFDPAIVEIFITLLEEENIK